MAAVNTWEASASTTNPIISDKLPAEVIECLKHARFLHLATCIANRPHVSLMNYTYLPAHPFPDSPFSAGPTIIMTTNPSSKKTLNLLENPNVSLLVHDWVSARPPASSSTNNRERSPVGGARSSSLANMLMQMNSAAVSSISVTINGEATVLETGTEEEKWCREQHLANNTFEAGAAADISSQLFGTSPEQSRTGDGGRGSYIEREEVKVVVVKIRDGRISDWKGSVKDWAISERDTSATTVNGVVGTV